MEILEILKTNADDLIPEDLELFRTELVVGEYTEEYKAKCIEIIERLENWNSTSNSGKSKSQEKPVVLNSSFIPANKSGSTTSFLEQFKADLNAMRLSDSYKTKFKSIYRTMKNLQKVLLMRILIY